MATRPRSVRAPAARSAAAPRALAPRRRAAAARAPREINWRVVGGGVSLAAILVGVVAELAVLFPSGSIGEPTSRHIGLAVGWTAPLLPLWPFGLGVLGLVKALRPERPAPRGRVWGAALVHLALIGLFHLVPIGGPGGLARAQAGNGGGLVGFALGTGLSEALGPAAAVLLLLAGLLIGGLFAVDVTLSRAAAWLFRVLAAGLRTARAWRERRREAMRINSPQARAEPLPSRLTRLVKRPGRRRTVGEEAPIEELPLPAPPSGPVHWKLPPLNVYEAGSMVELSDVDVRQRARTIEETLASFNIEARVVEVNQGPTVTQFGIEPAAGVPVRKILTLQNDIGLRLGAWPVRFEAPVPGKRVVGLEVPNVTVAVVGLRGLLESDEGARVRSKLKLPLGRDVSGRAVLADLAKMPHLLIAGATGSGKSVCINSILASLLSQNTPDDLQFLMIDPKMVELMPYNGIPHLRMPVVTDMEQVVGTLKWTVKEMERRYALFVKHAARNIESYNRVAAALPGERPLPYLVLVIDELADMMMTVPDEAELLICRLAQKARATGIHLIVATQRPSVDVLTGMIKANFVTRIAFAVGSQVDSRVILDTVGAEKLLGRGDMLFSSGDTAKPQRLQGAWVSDQELHKLVTHWKRQGLPRFTEGDVQEMHALAQPDEANEEDDLFDKAVNVANQYSRVSTSLLQRRLGVGYPRAARLIDLMEERGVIVSSEDGKSREVLRRAEAPEVD